MTEPVFHSLAVIISVIKSTRLTALQLCAQIVTLQDEKSDISRCNTYFQRCAWKRRWLLYSPAPWRKQSGMESLQCPLCRLKFAVKSVLRLSFPILRRGLV